MELFKLTIHEAADLMGRGEATSLDITRSLLDRIEAVDPKIGAFLTITRDEALAAAEAADQDRAKGSAGPLCGVPLAVKDVLCTKGIRTTCASKILANFIPPYDAHVISRLKEAGAVILGKLNMDEFAMGSSTENSGFQVTRNPWDTDCIPGGSSGGSAAAVAADLCLGSLGSDTGGSIRQPASHCGVVGLKPTYGRVSRYGLVAFASSLDQIGPITKDVTDAALLLSATAGHDPRDSTSVDLPVPDYRAALGRDLAGMRVGLPVEYFQADGVHPDVKAAVENAVETLRGLGVETVEVSLPHSDYAVAAYYIIAPAEASSNLARYDGVRYGVRAKDPESMLDLFRKSRSQGFGKEVQRRILIGTYALSSGYYDAYYRKASQVRTLIIEDYKKAFANVDAVLAPAAPTPAFKIGENADDPLTMYLSDIFTLSTNLAGICGISVPCGFSSDGLPVGIQILGDHFAEETIFSLAGGLEKALGITGKRPTL